VREPNTDYRKDDGDSVNYKGEITMGYRSEVGYVLTFPSKVKREEFVALTKLIGDEVEIAAAILQEYDGVLQDTAEDRLVYGLRFHETCVKWYATFEDVKAHNKLMKMCINNALRGKYEFVRIGEEDGDIEREEQAHDSFREKYINRVHVSHPEIVFEDW
jgi:hypothetical protein